MADSLTNTDARRYRRYAESTEREIDADKRRLLDELLAHRGYENRVSAVELADQTGINDSTVRDVIIELREEFGVPVANRGSGYFLIETADELAEIVEYYDQEIQTKRERKQQIVAAFNRSGTVAVDE